ncbi:YbbR-like domain-containing protein [Lysinibacillus odysseyi]|uniref:CdaR family protein n=1 Tax=Lysinibacillus odysseyi TaxID=202611 RepID=UPI000562227D|nr:CdaR family protein [Lysinibacillus odysseyi]
MDKLFDSYWALRIIAFVLALALFFYVKTGIDAGRENNPTADLDILYNVPLEVYYDDENLLVTGLPETVDVTISGSPQLIAQTKIRQDYKVFVDLNSLMIGEHHVPIQYEGFSDKLNVSIEPSSVNIGIEERVTKEFKIDPEMSNRLLADDYVVKDMTVNPSTVKVTGAKSVIESISYVKATVTGEQGIKESFEQDANVKVLNTDLNRLDVVVQPEKVKVKAEIEEYSREVPITIKQTGQLKEGISLDKIFAEPSKLKVYGKKALIDELKEIVVEFDVSDLEETGSYEAKLKLPEGMSVKADAVTIHAEVSGEPVSPAEDVAEKTEADSAE